MSKVTKTVKKAAKKSNEPVVAQAEPEVKKAPVKRGLVLHLRAVKHNIMVPFIGVTITTDKFIEMDNPNGWVQSQIDAGLVEAEYR